MCDENVAHLQQRGDGGLRHAPGKRNPTRREPAAVRTVFQSQRTDHIPGNSSTFERRIPLSNTRVQQKKIALSYTLIHLTFDHDGRSPSLVVRNRIKPWLSALRKFARAVE
jgi:hypothetical protein